MLQRSLGKDKIESALRSALLFSNQNKSKSFNSPKEAEVVSQPDGLVNEFAFGMSIKYKMLGKDPKKPNIFYLR